MTITKAAATTLGVLSALFAFAAAWYWYVSTKVEVGLGDRLVISDRGPIQAPGLESSMLKQSKLNRTAAAFAGMSALAGGISSLVGALS